MTDAQYGEKATFLYCSELLAFGATKLDLSRKGSSNVTVTVTVAIS